MTKPFIKEITSDKLMNLCEMGLFEVFIKLLVIIIMRFGVNLIMFCHQNILIFINFGGSWGYKHWGYMVHLTFFYYS